MMKHLSLSIWIFLFAVSAGAQYGPAELWPLPRTLGARQVVEMRIDRSDSSKPAKQYKTIYTLDSAGRPIRANEYAQHGWLSNYALYTYDDSLLTSVTNHYRPGPFCINCPKPMTDSPFRATSSERYRYHEGRVVEKDFLYFTPEPYIEQHTRTAYDSRGRFASQVWKSRDGNPLQTQDSLLCRYNGDTAFYTGYDFSWIGLSSSRDPIMKETVRIVTKNERGQPLRNTTIVSTDGLTGSAVHRYDAAGRKVGFDASSLCSECPGGMRRSKEVWRYDTLGRLKSITHSLNGRVVYEYRFTYLR